MSGVAYNSQLKAWQQPRPTYTPGAGTIEEPGCCANIVWQTRPCEPGEYELSLAEALERVFDSGASELQEVVQRLNALGLRDQSGQVWTEDAFRQAMAALGY